MKQTWILEREIKWQMGHALIDYVGPCSRVHGHEFSALIQLEFTKLNSSSMGVDFTEMKKVEKWIDNNWDHRTLLPYNHLALQPYIQGEEQWDPIINEIGFVPVPFNPTCEMLSQQLAIVTAELMSIPIENVGVRIKETSKNSCLYFVEQEFTPDIQEKMREVEKLLRGIHTDEESFIS